jgi:large subunit ribosomal protein L19
MYKLNKKLEMLITIKVGSIIKLGIKIQEGQKTRIQFYAGIVISKKNCGINTTFTLRRITKGISLERCFLLYSPKIDSITVQKSSKIRRSKLYFLRHRSGKSKKLKSYFN